MNQYSFITPELHDLIQHDIDDILRKNPTDINKIIANLKKAEEENIELIKSGIQDMASYINIDKSTPHERLIERIKSINDIAESQDNVDLSDLSITFAAFLLTIDCDFLGYKFHTENVVLECRALFEKERQYLKLINAATEHQSKLGKSNIAERYKGQDLLIKTIIDEWLDENKPNIFKFNQQHFQKFYDLSRRLNAKIESEGTMHARIELWLEDFSKLVSGEKAHKPRNIIKELAKKHLSTAQ